MYKNKAKQILSQLQSHFKYFDMKLGKVGRLGNLLTFDIIITQHLPHSEREIVFMLYCNQYNLKITQPLPHSERVSSLRASYDDVRYLHEKYHLNTIISEIQRHLTLPPTGILCQPKK